MAEPAEHEIQRAIESRPEPVRGYLRAMTLALVKRAGDRLDGYGESGWEPAERLGSAEDLAGRMSALVPTRHPWDDEIGPFYEMSGVARLLGISRQAVHERSRRGSLLSLRTRDGHLVYPAAHFDGGKVLTGLPTVLVAFRGALASGGADEWAVAAWLTAPNLQLEGRTPLGWLRAGRGAEPVQQSAARTAARWSA